MSEGAGATTTANTIYFDVNYLKTPPAILKIVCALSSLAGFICVENVTYELAWSHYTWSSFVFISGFCITVVFILFYLFHIVETLHQLPWLFIEGSYDIIWCVLFFAAACVSARNVTQQTPWGFAACFGFLATVILGYDAFLKHKQWRSGGVAQSERREANTYDSI